MHQKKIFREYDVRGVYGTDYNDDFAELLARAYAQYLKDKTKASTLRVALGRDVRPSGEKLSKRFMQGLTESGINVVDLGVVPTPLVYFSTHHLKVDGAVCITGSHNPAEYNGFKICVGTSTLHGEQIQHLLKICTELEKSKPQAANKGTVVKYDIIAPYTNDVVSRIKLERPVKVVIDSGNGTAGAVAPELLRQLGCKVTELYCELDGSFPNHHPDPTVVENLEDLQEAVVAEHAELGIAFDGDSDRIGAVDEKKNPIFGDQLMVLYAREILTRKPGATIISEVKSSRNLYADIAKRGGRPIMWKTGHSLIKSKMKEEKAELAGEMSGHMFFADRYYGYDDAIYAAARLLEIVSRTKNPVSTLLADLPKCVCTPEIRMDCPDEVKFDVVESVKKELSKVYKTIDTDGVRVETEKGWGLLRASNTQPVVVMRFEAESRKDLEHLQNIVESAFQKALRAATGKDATYASH